MDMTAIETRQRETSVEVAQAACNKDPTCVGLLDSGCNGTSVKLCSEITAEAGTGCVYEKLGRDRLVGKLDSQGLALRPTVWALQLGDIIKGHMTFRKAGATLRLHSRFGNFRREFCWRLFLRAEFAFGSTLDVFPTAMSSCHKRIPDNLEEERNWWWRCLHRQQFWNQAVQHTALRSVLAKGYISLCASLRFSCLLF